MIYDLFTIIAAAAVLFAAGYMAIAYFLGG